MGSVVLNSRPFVHILSLFARILPVMPLILLCGNPLLDARQASAAGAISLGEMRTYGGVLIRSSTGDWTPAPALYPILQNTEIMTGQGSALLYYKDGSRIYISESAEAVLEGEESRYVVRLSKGNLSVSSGPASSLLLAVGSSQVSIKGDGEATSPPGSRSGGRFLGIVTADDRGIDVQSIEGTARVKPGGGGEIMLSSGEGMHLPSEKGGAHYAPLKTPGMQLDCKKVNKCKKKASPSDFSCVPQYVGICKDGGPGAD